MRRHSPLAAREYLVVASVLLVMATGIAALYWFGFGAEERPEDRVGQRQFARNEWLEQKGEDRLQMTTDVRRILEEKPLAMAEVQDLLGRPDRAHEMGKDLVEWEYLLSPRPFEGTFLLIQFERNRVARTSTYAQ